MPIFDVHGHIGVWPFPIPACDVSDVQALMRRHGIGACLVSSAKAIVYDMEEGNAELAEAIRDAEGVYGYVVVNPNYLDRSRAELDRYYARSKLVGAKIHPSYSRTPIGANSMRALVAEVARRGRPLLIHCWGEGEVAAAGRLAMEFPSLAIILGHGGGGAWREGAQAAAEHPNLYVEFCCSVAHKGKIAEAVRVAGPGKVLFGSDLTLLDPGYTLGLVQDAGLDEAKTRMILWDNARNLFRKWMP